MKKSQIKPIIKAIIREAMMSNSFRVVLFGSKLARNQFGAEFVRTGKGQLETQVTFPSANSTAYVVWKNDVMTTMDAVLKKMGWKRQAVKGKDIIWLAPDWNAQTAKDPTWSHKSAERGASLPQPPVKENILSNIFRVIIYGNQEQRTEVNKEFVRAGGGKLFATFTPVDVDTSMYTIRNTKALEVLEAVLKQLGWDRKGLKGHKDIVWTAPGWLGTKEKMVEGRSTPEAKIFAKEVRDKMADRTRKQGSMGYNDLDALMGIIEHKLAKEGWVKGGLKLPPVPTEPGTHEKFLAAMRR